MDLSWIESLHRTGKWRPLADWIVENGDEKIQPAMLKFAADLAKGKRRPSDKQIRLLIALASQIQALHIWDNLLAGHYDYELATQDDTASAEQGAELLALILKRRAK